MDASWLKPSAQFFNREIKLWLSPFIVIYLEASIIERLISDIRNFSESEIGKLDKDRNTIGVLVFLVAVSAFSIKVLFFLYRNTNKSSAEAQPFRNKLLGTSVLESKSDFSY